MKYFSLNNRDHRSTFENAVIKGLAPDKGLYFPEEIARLPVSFFEELHSLSKSEIAHTVIKDYIGDEIPEQELLGIIEHTLDFDFPVIPVEKNIQVLELFHGPTKAFKDVGARFMAGCLGYFIKKGNLGKITVLVATSGDTGGAVANGFLGVEGIDVVILYPKGKVSEIQEKQLTTLGQNIVALEVDGAFDDCQDMVKRAFLDAEIQDKRQLTSANSINVARWLPQMFYYFIAVQQLQLNNKKVVFSVPSGNFGNICAGMLAAKMGLSIHHFVASSNANNVVDRYLASEKFEPKPSVQTISNAMDVGNPSNFIRVQELFQQTFTGLKEKLSSYSFTDLETENTMRKVFKEANYVLDPHGAVGYLGLQKFLATNLDYMGVFLETAHPVKFLETVEKAIGEKLEIPASIQAVMDKEKKAILIKDYKELKSFLLS
ncbi:threonine synthase [Gillisia sp. Hel_I_86]|uniref:threonine synthase n=1 Tax=Gillisia sp. Hel_I_86 TaxID=1249981 RepID=UPI001199EC5D|nr:threonine synthase [Gillisia sp. Hel_I_86]TVZ28340.1 threonine synthase [Gillisia sp. Hel_I_86]